MNVNLNLKEFLNYLNRFKWLVIFIPVICAVLTYFYVQRLPKKYKSESLIYTGLTKQFDQSAINNSGQSLDYFKLSQQFGNLLEMMKSKQIINGLSYKLILHDLKDSVHAFQKYPKIISNLSTFERQVAIDEYAKRYAANVLISTADNGSIKLYDILGATGYNEDNILKNLSIARNGESDFIKVTYISPNPDLSAFVVNTLSNDFILYYTNLSLTGQRQSLSMLDSLLVQKRNELSKKNAEMQSSAAAQAAAAAGSLNAQKRSDIALQQLAEAQTQRSQVVRNISSTEGALNEINKKLNGSGGYLKQDAIKDNSEIINIDNQLQIANQRYVNNNFRAEDRAIIDSLQRVKSRLITSSSRLNTNNATALKQQLIDQKIKLENDLASYRSALSTIDQQISVLSSKTSGEVTALNLVNGNQQLQANDADLAAKDYAGAQTQYDQALMLIKTGVKLNLAEPGLPGPSEPSKNILFVASSGIASLMICLMTLFITFMLNNTVSSPERLESYTHLKVIGSLNFIPEQNKYLRDIWEDNGNIKNYSIYKDNLRSIRFELNKYLNETSTVLGVTSLSKGAGKTFLAGSLSYAFAMMGKNVLLICERNTTLNDLLSHNIKKTDTAQKFESFLVKKQIQIEDRITILNKSPTNNSLLELRDNRSLISGFKILKDTFDIIIVDIDNTEGTHLVKEWLMFCDKSICVFNSGDKISESDKLFIQYLSSQKGFLGWVLNKVKIKN